MSFIPKTAFRFAIPVFALCMMVLLTASVTKAGEIYTSGWSGAAIDGTDPVAYFTDGRAVEGSKIFTMKWRGATWRFASAENLATFKAAPEKYAPQYGGYCAWAVRRLLCLGREPGLFSENRPRCLEDRRWQTLSQLLEGCAATVATGYGRKHRQGRRQLAESPRRAKLTVGQNRSDSADRRHCFHALLRARG